jgi:flagellar hook-associated protein FlgK
VDETIKLQQYQKVYEAASLVLKVQNEMVGSLLNAIA